MECLNKFFFKKPPDDYEYRELQMKVELLEEQISLEIDEKNRHRNTIKRLTSLTDELREEIARLRTELDDVWNFEVENLRAEKYHLLREKEELKNKLNTKTRESTIGHHLHYETSAVLTQVV